VRYKEREYRRWRPELVARSDAPVYSHLLNGYKVPVRNPDGWLKVPVPTPRRWLGVPIPRKRQEAVVPISSEELEKANYCVALFRDASGRHWFRSTSGNTIRTDWHNVFRDEGVVPPDKQVKDE
jgi:hypothetical protein